MIGDVFSLPAWACFLIPGVVLLSMAALIHLVTFRPANRSWVLSFGGIAPPFFTSTAVLFALLTGFLANDAWERNKQASRAVLAERDGLLAVHNLSVAAVSDMAPIRALIRDYARLAVSEEWPKMRIGERSPETGRALGALLQATADPAIAREAGQAVSGVLLESVMKIRSARYDRLAISADRSDSAKWAAVLFLAVVTQAAIGVVHLERSRAQLLSLLIFSLAAATALGLIAVRERPFGGPMRVPPRLSKIRPGPPSTARAFPPGTPDTSRPVGCARSTRSGARPDVRPLREHVAS